jgi:hypothetical protein
VTFDKPTANGTNQLRVREIDSGSSGLTYAPKGLTLPTDLDVPH